MTSRIKGHLEKGQIWKRENGEGQLWEINRNIWKMESTNWHLWMNDKSENVNPKRPNLQNGNLETDKYEKGKPGKVNTSKQRQFCK